MRKNNASGIVRRGALVLTAFGSVLATQTASAQTPAAAVPSLQLPNEISVSAEAYAWAGPDKARVTLLVEDSNQSAEAAEKSLAAKEAAILSALKARIPTIQLMTSGGSLGPAGGPKSMAAMTGASGYRVIRELAFETTVLNRVGELVDIAVKAGPAALREVNYRVRDDAKTKEAAYQEAAKRARGHAQALADALGLKLGQVLGVTVTEEPEGFLTRENQSLGLEPVKSGDRELRIYVNLRVEIAK